MFPLSWLLLAWLVVVGFFLILALLTLVINIKYAVSSFTTYAMTALFLGVTVLILFLAASYISTVDWSQDVNMTPSFSVNSVTNY